VKNHLEIVPVKWIDKVLEVALESAPQPLPEEEVVKAEAVPAAAAPAAATDGAQTAEAIKH
jgi:ATP-dependent Lon protease